MSELGPDAIAANSVQLFSEAQFADRERWNQTHKAMHRDARGALLRALTEMNQMLQMGDALDQRLAQGAEPPGPSEPEAVWWAMESMDGQSHLLPTGPDTTHDIGLSVVKVLVPGMRHFWPRFAPGRLYDVPVELGWLDHPLTETELNSTPIFW